MDIQMTQSVAGWRILPGQVTQVENSAEVYEEGIVGGAGSLLVAVVVFGFIGYVLYRRSKVPATKAAQLPQTERRTGLLWLGILFTLAPGLLYLYLYCAEYRFPFGAFSVLSIPILIGGLGCIIAALWPGVRNRAG